VDLFNTLAIYLFVIYLFNYYIICKFSRSNLWK